MKKRLCFALVTAMVLLMSACSSTTSQEPATPTAAVTTEAVASSQSASDTAAPATTEAVKKEVNWPDKKPIEIVIGAGAGGDCDAQVRRIVKYLEKELDTDVAVINMGGSSAQLAGTHVKEAAPDGLTVLSGHAEAFAPHFFGIEDNTVDDYEIACIYCFDDTLCFATRTGSPYPTIESLVEAAKANPGQIELPAMQPGGYSYMGALLFQTALGVEFNLTDIENNGAKITQLLAGKIDVMGNQYSMIKDYVANGDFVPYCVLSDERNAGFPEVPTLKELGFESQFTTLPKYFFFAFPKGTDPEIVKKMSEATRRVTENPDYQKDCADVYTRIQFMDSDDATEYIKSQCNEVYAPLAKSMGF